MNQWFVEVVDRFSDQSINASAHSADPLRPATARRATNSARTSWLGRPTQATGVEGATGRERGDAISGHMDRRIVVPIGPCPTQSINSPAHSPLPTARRATLSPARSARPPSSGGLHGGWCSTRPGSPRHRKIVLRTIAIFLRYLLSRTGVQPVRDNNYLEKWLWSSHPPKASHKVLRVDGWAIQLRPIRFTVV